MNLSANQRSLGAIFRASLSRVAKNILRLRELGYCSRTKVKSSLILRRFYATWPWPLFAHPSGCWVLTIRMSLGSKSYIPFEVWLIRVWVCVMMSVIISPQYRLPWRPPVESFPFYITHGMSLRELPVTVIQRGTWLSPKMGKWILPCKNK